ncbi:hypothetical protein [Halomarina ordinaria]|uniref:Uncharacterized protein n=1 Tax=Halomarina ordinaria TaxID=3033939 RepID=A0ABD5U927_9EURY|nr:hypothetical protein [Halomarina sp. PSRA2]
MHELPATRVAVRLWVPRGAAGDLAGGARRVLEAVSTVDRVETLEVTGFRPTATDVRVEVRATVALAAGTDAADLEAGFGVVEAAVDA